MRLTSLGALLTLFFATTAAGQEIRFYIFDGDTGHGPLVNARVAIDGETRGVTNADGHFVATVKPGKHTVKCIRLRALQLSSRSSRHRKGSQK